LNIDNEPADRPIADLVVDTLAVAWMAPIPQDSKNPELAKDLKSYRTYLIIAVFFLVFVARAVPAGGGGLGANLVSSVVTAGIVAIFDRVFGANSIFLQFNLFLTLLFQLILFVLIDVFFAHSVHYGFLQSEYGWQVPGLIGSSLLVLIALVVKSALQTHALKLSTIWQALLIVGGMCAVLYLMFEIDDATIGNLLGFGGAQAG
jgi:hypothetical protein